jgi:hypothetical protein
VPQNDEDLTEDLDDAPSEETIDTPAGRKRVVRCPFTGRRVIATCPDGSMVSSREMYALLRDGDPVDLVYLDTEPDLVGGGRCYAAE